MRIQSVILSNQHQQTVGYFIVNFWTFLLLIARRVVIQLTHQSNTVGLFEANDRGLTRGLRT